MINFAILGLGKIAKKFAEDLALVDGGQLVAVGSRSQERAAAFAKTYGAEHAAGAYEEVFSGPRVDVVYIATPHTQHAELTTLCLKRGVAVLCEKPLGLHASEVEKVVALARQSKVFLMEALWTQFLPSFNALLGEIEDGKIGSVTGLSADFGFKVGPRHTQRILDLDLGGGALLDIGIYPVFLAQAVFGKPANVEASARFHESGADIDDAIVLTYPEGQRASLHTTLLAKTRTEATIYGTTGTIYVKGDWYKQTSFEVVPDDGEPYTIAPEAEGWGYCHEARAVVADLKAGKTENAQWSLDDSLQLHRTLTDIRDTIGLRYPDDPS